MPRPRSYLTSAWMHPSQHGIRLFTANSNKRAWAGSGRAFMADMASTGERRKAHVETIPAWTNVDYDARAGDGGSGGRRVKKPLLKRRRRGPKRDS
ncbi:hypothetical protein G6O67_007675 [Ophiocordyceps sinensis]|uniref:Uncharacterized protein n=1 Tax=Ophiocordyceps sinensis TaxID=72228 RepID=A0A8H4LUU3_9HYPO|nr:hypothetical protein G6O67_007675 [Ophiocordyceps sinensis]